MGEAEFAHRAAERGRGRRARHRPPAGGRPPVRVDPEERQARSRLPRRAHVARRAHPSSGLAVARLPLRRVARRRHGDPHGRFPTGSRRSSAACGGRCRAFRSPSASASRRRNRCAPWRPSRTESSWEARSCPRWKRPSGTAAIPSRRAPASCARSRSRRRKADVPGDETGLSARISKADRSTLVALVAENLTRFTERDALQVLRHPHASEAMIEEILSSKTLLAFRGVQAPRRRASPDAAARGASLPRGPPLARSSRHRPRDAHAPARARRGEPEARGSPAASSRWARRLAVARFAASALFPPLLDDPDLRVLEAVLANPRLTSEDVQRWLATGHPRPEALALLAARQPRWVSRPAVRIALLTHRVDAARRGALAPDVGLARGVAKARGGSRRRRASWRPVRASCSKTARIPLTGAVSHHRLRCYGEPGDCRNCSGVRRRTSPRTRITRREPGTARARRRRFRCGTSPRSSPAATNSFPPAFSRRASCA